MSDLYKEVSSFVSLVKQSKFLVVLTGAGISTESGIPDYRSPGTGLWNKIDQSVVSLEGFLKNPEKYYTYALELHPIRRAAKPNTAHYMLVEFEKKGFLKGIITQNVDGLHYEAGSENVKDLHGSLTQVVCLSCNLLSPMEDSMQRFLDGEKVPLCSECGGVLKPNAVFFGEYLPRVPWQQSLELSEQADLFIAIGSSLQVAPASVLPDLALKNGAKLIVLNLTDTPYDGDAELVVRQKIGKFSQEVLKVGGF